VDSESVTHDALPDGLVVADAYGNVVLTNDVAREQLGLDGDGGIGRPLRDVLLLRDRDGTEWWTMHRPYDGLVNRVSFTEQSWILPRGDEVLVTGRLVRAGRGGPVSRVGVVLRSARGRERLDRERSDLVATVAHELRSPLTGVRGFVTTLINRWESFNDEQKKLMLATVSADQWASRSQQRRTAERRHDKPNPTGKDPFSVADRPLSPGTALYARPRPQVAQEARPSLRPRIDGLM